MEKEITLTQFIRKQQEKEGCPESYIIKFKGKNFKGLVSYEHGIWADKEHCGIKVYEWKDRLDIPEKELRNMMSWILEGKKICSKCHKPIEGKCEQYFAGTYCTDCWTEDMERYRAWDYSHLD